MSEKLPLRHGWPHWPCWNFPLLGDNAILHILFVAYLMAQSVNETYDVECCDDRNRFVRKPLWSNLTDCPRICLDGLKEITRKLGQGSQCPDLWQNGCLTNISQLLTAWINLVEFTFWGRGGRGHPVVYYQICITYIMHRQYTTYIKQDAIITVKLYLATCFGCDWPSSGQLRTTLRYSKNIFTLP